jgi:hypothetical protein
MLCHLDPHFALYLADIYLKRASLLPNSLITYGKANVMMMMIIIISSSISISMTSLTQAF